MKPYTIHYVKSFKELPSLQRLEVLAPDRPGVIDAAVKKLKTHEFLIMKIEEGWTSGECKL